MRGQRLEAERKGAKKGQGRSEGRLGRLSIYSTYRSYTSGPDKGRAAIMAMTMAIAFGSPWSSWLERYQAGTKFG